MLGQVLPSLAAPIGFNWQISITLVPGLAAREVAVAALGTVYTVSSADSTVAAQLTAVIATGWPRATVFSLLAWYVFAPQCMSLNRHGIFPVKPPPVSTVTESAPSGSRRENPMPASATLASARLAKCQTQLLAETTRATRICATSSHGPRNTRTLKWSKPAENGGRMRISPLVFVLGLALAVGAIFPSYAQAPATRSAAFLPPNEADIPQGPMGDSIRYGAKLLKQTQIYAKDYVGNGLNCTSCHLNGGTTAYASPWVGIWGVFPEYRSRNAKVNALQERINDCFQRSMNGKSLPVDGDEMHAILSYMWWLSKDVPTGMDVEGRGFKRIKLPDPVVIDPVRGAQLYTEKCTACHGVDGQGLNGADGAYLFPALWGAKSFNIGAGMARLANAAAFTKANMPLGSGNSLSDKDAIDIAAYFTRQPRPDFAAKSKDWPKGDKPTDARY